MERTQVPKFGNWGSEEVPYTMYFDNARKGKKSGQIYQDNVEANTLTHSEEESEVRRSTEWSQKGPNPPEVVKPRHDRRSSREEGEMRRLYDSPLRHESGARRTSSNSSPHHRSSAGDTPKRLARHSVGSDRSTDHSPLHPQGPKGGGKSIGISSPSWERKGAASDGGTHGLAPSTPGRSRLRSVTRGDESPDRGPAVPKFGEWDETDPAAAEGYTQVFNKVREEKHSETGKVPPLIPTESLSHSTPHKHYANDNAKGCGCFLWGKR